MANINFDVQELQFIASILSGNEEPMGKKIQEKINRHLNDIIDYNNDVDIEYGLTDDDNYGYDGRDFEKEIDECLKIAGVKIYESVNQPIYELITFDNLQDEYHTDFNSFKPLDKPSPGQIDACDANSIKYHIKDCLITNEFDIAYIVRYQTIYNEEEFDYDYIDPQIVYKAGKSPKQEYQTLLQKL